MTDDDVTRMASATPTAFAAADASTEDVNELAHKFSPNAMRVLALIAVDSPESFLTEDGGEAAADAGRVLAAGHRDAWRGCAALSIITATSFSGWRRRA
ncbi:MAG TPA: hypothetical protein VFE60_19015 [Roseiarcus sp.]|nr:hypothetical protein [Roseiarcus sp.]